MHSQQSKETSVTENSTVITQSREEVKTAKERFPVISSADKTEIWNTQFVVSFTHICTLVIIGLLIWGLLWSAWGDSWKWDGHWFKLALVAVVAWASGQALESLTTLPPLMAALLIGILARNLNILDMREYSRIDAFLRKIYPVVILGKASLGWNVTYMKKNWFLITRLGVVPWIAEVTAVAVSTYYFLGFPWTWGFLLGSIYASVSCAVVMPSVLLVSADAVDRNWSQLVCTAGGIDTALSVGVFGIIYSIIFFDVDYVYTIVKAALTLFVGVALGVAWGSLARLAPHSQDFYVTELRILFVLVGGLFANFATSALGWVGTGGVAVLACNATAAAQWVREGWKLNNNPASTTYRVLWSALEPMVFAYTGTFFVIERSSAMSRTMMLGFGILVLCLMIRLVFTFLVCWNLTIKERLFVCCTWMPKSIVEAVLCPLAIDTLILTGSTEGLEYAEQLMKLIVQNILITTPLGFLFTRHLGPYLIRKTQHHNDSEIGSQLKPSCLESQNKF